MKRRFVVEIEGNNWVTAEDLEAGIQREIAEYVRDHKLPRGKVSVTEGRP